MRRLMPAMKSPTEKPKGTMRKLYMYQGVMFSVIENVRRQQDVMRKAEASGQSV